ncbi:hypothetical protein CRYUN_Cryun40dG0058100 [Craigia yunnanensis]
MLSEATPTHHLTLAYPCIFNLSCLTSTQGFAPSPGPWLSDAELNSSHGFLSEFVRNVVVSFEYGQEEELFGSDDGKRASTISPDLKLFVGNLLFSVDSAQLAGLFGSAGKVEMVEVIYDKITGRSRGFAFVTVFTIEKVEAIVR